MKLFYSPFACSFAAHVAAREAGFDLTLCRVDLRTKKTDAGGDLYADNPMGQVPTLVDNEGAVFTENSAVLQVIADRAPGSGLAPSWGTPQRYELIRWLSFVGTEVHKKVLASIYDPISTDAVKEFARARAARPLDVLAKHLEARETLLEGGFSVADAYLFWALLLLPRAGIPLDHWPTLEAYFKRHQGRPAISEALRIERAAAATAS